MRPLCLSRNWIGGLVKRTAILALATTAIVATVCLLVLDRCAIAHSGVMPIEDRFRYYKLYADLAKAVLVGFGATLLGILIPALFAESRFSFERLRDSRTAYSEAKTSIDYLPLRLCTLNLREAVTLVQKSHVRKHEAELYPELKVHLRRRGIPLSPDAWGDSLYNRLFNIRECLEAHVSDWDTLNTGARLAILRKASPASPKET
jgi:hypothetical protein